MHTWRTWKYRHRSMACKWRTLIRAWQIQTCPWLLTAFLLFVLAVCSCNMPSDELVITLQCRTCTGAMFAGTPAFHRVCLLAVAGFDCCSGVSFLCRTCLSCGTPSLLTVLALNWWILSLLQCCCIYAKHVSLAGLKVRYSTRPCGIC